MKGNQSDLNSERNPKTIDQKQQDWNACGNQSS